MRNVENMSSLRDQRKLPRIGVILCQCGKEIRDALNFVELEEHARALPGVVYLKADPYPCSRPGIAALTSAIKENQLERVVIAGCTPRLHGRLMAQACESAGLNRWFVEIANIREHCSRVHKDKPKATEKAKELIAGSVRKVSLATACEPVRSKPRTAILVAGGGVSGLSVAAKLADLNHDVTLIEKKDVLGGMLLRLDKPYPYGRPAKEIVKERISRIDGRVKILKQTEIVSLKGAPGQYMVQLSIAGKTEEQVFGAIVVAIGAECVALEETLRAPLLEGLADFGGRVLTQIELEAELAGQGLKGIRSALVVSMPLPQLSHSGSRLYTLVALKNAALLKEANTELQVWFLFKDVPSELEREFRRAKGAGVNFVRPEDETMLKFVKDGLRGCGELEINVDVIVLPTVLAMPQSARNLAQILRIPIDSQGFFIQPHIKLWQGDFAERGIFVVGSCHSPATLLESAAQAEAAASWASRFVSGEIVRAPFLSKIDRKVCRGCSRCAETCEWDAIEMTTLDNGLKLAIVDEILCTGCGVCSTVCINGAPSLAPVSQRQIRAMLEVVGA